MKIVLIIILLYVSSICNGQNAIKDSVFSCNLFQNLKFDKKDIDTLNIKAIYVSIGRPNSFDSIIHKIRKSYRLNLYSSSFQYAVEFLTPNCNKTYYISSKDTKMIDKLYKLPTETKVVLNCIVFKNFYFTDTNKFFFINKVIVDKNQ